MRKFLRWIAPLILTLVEDMIKLFSIQARQKKVHLFLVVPNEMREVFVSADEHKLAQVLRNLLANAVKFTLPDGNITVKMTRITRISNYDWIRIEVIDDGFGLTKVIIMLCFSSF